MIQGLDHVNLRTADLTRAIEWYRTVLGLEQGARPAFGNPGAWMYAEGRPIVHLSLVANVHPPHEDLTLEHFALRASGLKEFLALLRDRGEEFSLIHLPPGNVDLVQVNIHDPDGNHIHVDFPGTEARALGL